MEVSNGKQLPVWVKELWKELTTPPGFLNPPSTAKPVAKSEPAPQTFDSRPNRPTDRVSERQPRTSRPRSSANNSSYDEEEDEEDGEGIEQSPEDIRVVLRANGYHPRIVEQYPFTVYRAVPYPSVMQLRTSVGDIALKRAHVKKRKLQFMFDALQYLETNGFTRFSRIIPTIKNTFYSPFDEQLYYASQWIQGQPADLTSVPQVGQAALAIAEFHLASRGFESAGFNPPAAFEISKTIRARAKEFDIFLSKAKSKGKPDPVDRFVSKQIPAYQKQAQQALSFLEDPRCQDFFVKEEELPGLCHLDITPQNLVYSDKTGMHLIDFELTAHGPRMLDIAHLIRRSLQQSNWRRETALVPLVQINQVEPLRHAEYRILQSILTFPHSVWRTCHNHYMVRPTPYTLARLQQLYEQEHDRQLLLDELRQHVDRHRGS
jgi:CotS family spore coat protein